MDGIGVVAIGEDVEVVGKISNHPPVNIEPPIDEAPAAQGDPTGTSPELPSAPRPTPGAVSIFGEFRFGSNGEVRARFTSQGEPAAIVAPLGTVAKGMVFAEREFRAADETLATNGISYLYYEGNWDRLPEFHTLRPVKSGTADNFTADVVDLLEEPDHFALLFNGYINIPSNGTYTFYTNSDDGSRLWIGSKLVVENDGLHGPQVRSGTIELVQGRHEITVAFFEKTGGATLEVKYKGPGIILEQAIPDASLFRSDAFYLYQAGSYRPALNRTPGSFSLRYAHQDDEIKDGNPLVYEDPARSFFVEPGRALVPAAAAVKADATYVYTFSSVQSVDTIDVPSERRWRFHPYYHPYVSAYIRELNRHGVPGLFNSSLQTAPQLGQPMNFLSDYQPVGSIVAVGADVLPVEEVDVSIGGAYSLYNWELFFHAPLLIADRLCRNQRFEEAQRWFHCIFDPTDRSSGPVPDRFWRFKRFHGVAQQSIQELLAILASDQKQAELRNQVRQWQDNPFNAHLIARMRIPAYQKTVVMKYIDNLIAWGDQLFRRDTVESINEATLLYILAAELLGPKPQPIDLDREAQPKTFAELSAAQDELQDDFLVSIESLIPAGAGEASTTDVETPELLTAPFYFCIPRNETLLTYWDTVADRLFKIRHCMSIEGLSRQLALFDAPLDPGLLARAAAAGVDLSSVLNDVNASLPHYRFRVMAQKATELCADLKALGSALLAALEKRDAEAMALLRSGHELRVLEAVKQVRARQIDEAQEALEGLRLSQKVTEIRRNYYKNIAKINPNEQAHMDLLGTAHVFSEIAQGINAGVAAAHLFPDFDVGVAGWCASPVVKASFGGNNLGSALQAAASVLNMISAQYTHDATMASIKGGYERRWEDWKHQEALAGKELEQLDKQILAAEIRVELAEKELENHELQIENAKQTDTFMRDKFTNRDLYDWMVSQISATYFQSYQMAYDIAKRTQRAFQYECGMGDTFVEFGYWDSLKKGLLAGEKLHHDLKRMEIAYLDQHRRDYEITKHVSLTLINPAALLTLKQTGECFVDLPEELFDMDHPGHYLRRIKSLNITIPCVTGPYTSVNSTVTLLWNTVRRNTLLNTLLANDAYARSSAQGVPLDDSRFIDNIGAVQSIVTSSAREDSGLFEQNLQDERYLPFEGAGAVSRWRIQLPKETNQLDFSTITDVVFTVRYTAREGGELLRAAALNHLTELLTRGALFRVFSARHNFSDAWHRFLTPARTGPRHVLEMKDLRKYVPPVLGSSDLEIKSMLVVLGIKGGISYNAGPPLNFFLEKNGTPVGGVEGVHSLQLNVAPVAALPAARVLPEVPPAQVPLDNHIWKVLLNGSDIDAIAGNNPDLVMEENVGGTIVWKLDPDSIEDVWFVIEYGKRP